MKVLDVKDPCDLFDKEIKGKFKTNNPTKQQLESIKNMDQN